VAQWDDPEAEAVESLRRRGDARYGPLGAQTVAILAGALVPLAVAVAWIPLRTRLPNTDLALILVGVIGSVGMLKHREAVIVAGISGALWFEFFDTVPYERWAIARNPDLETTVILAVVSVLGGELVLRARRYRKASRDDEENLTNVQAAAQLVASGEELVRVIESVAAQLTRLLNLTSCTFEADMADPPLPRVSRSGTVEPPDGPRLAPTEAAAMALAELAVVVQGQPLGYFQLRFGGAGTPTCERLRVAVTLADQVGAAFLAQAPPPPPEQPEPRLRVMRPNSERPADVTPALSRSSQETAGFSSQLGRMIS
jgi:hypothetical protein